MTNIISPDLLWEVVKRYDFYIETTNTRATILVVFDTFVLGTVVLNWKGILSNYDTYYIGKYLVIISLSTIAIASLVTLWKAFNVINSFLSPAVVAKEYHSKLSFFQISDYAEPENYFKDFQSLTQEELSRDLVKQAYSLSQGLEIKFKDMKTAIYSITWGQLFPLSIIIVVKFVTLIIDAYQQGVS